MLIGGRVLQGGTALETTYTKEDPGAGEESMLWLGAQVTEVEALFTLVLIAPTLLAERRALGELSEAADRLSSYARHMAAGIALKHTPAIQAEPRSARARRRAASAERAANRIISWSLRGT